MASKQLCGSARLEDLKPGEQRRVTVTVPERSFCYWDPEREPVLRPDGTRDKWVRTEGVRRVWVGGSSDAPALEGMISPE